MTERIDRNIMIEAMINIIDCTIAIGKGIFPTKYQKALMLHLEDVKTILINLKSK